MKVKLAARAQKLARKIYASLPFEYRFGMLMEILSSSYGLMQDTLGRVVYAEFLKQGVEGMPPAKGMLPEELRLLVETRGVGALPRGYGGSLARSIVAVVRKTIHNEDDAQDLIQNLIVDLSQKGLAIAPGSSLGKAEGYVIQRVKWMVSDFLKSTFRRKKNPPAKSLDEMIERETPFNMSDPQAMARVLNRMRPGDSAKLMRELRTVDTAHPERTEEYIMAMLQGDSKEELGASWGVTREGVAMWLKRHIPAIRAIWEKYFWSLREAV